MPIEQLIGGGGTILILVITFQECILSKILNYWRRDVASAVKVEADKLLRQDYFRIKEKFGSEQYTEYRTKRLRYFSQIIGYSEVIFFAGLVVILMAHDMNLIKGGDYFLKIFGGWLAIKTVSNYDQWSHVIAGKAYFYISIFGTFLNIIFAIFIGYLFFDSFRLLLL